MSIKNRKKAHLLLVNTTIIIVSVIFLLPFLWIIITSNKSQIEVLREPLKIIPEVPMFLENLKQVLSRADWPRYFANSLILTFMVWFVQMLVSIPAAYAFAVMKFPFKNLLFLLILLRLMISPESTMLSNYVTVLSLDAYDSKVGIMLPYIVSAQAIFLFRQAFKQIPASLRESARMDGCKDFQYMLKIGIPLIRPYIISFSVVTCVYQWNSFFWPNMIIKSPENRTLSVAMTYFGLQAESGSEWPLTMVAAILVSALLLILFIIFQKQFVNSFVNSGIK